MFDIKKAPYVKCMEPFVYVDMSSWSLQAKKPG